MGFDPIRPIRDAAHHIQDGVVHGLQDAGHHIEGGLRQAGNKIQSNLTQVAHQLEGEIKGVANEAHQRIDKVAHDAEGSLKSAYGTASQGIKEAAEQAKSGLKEKFPELLEDALQKTATSIASGALKKAVDVLQVAIPDSVELKLGPVGLLVEDVNDRIDTLQKWCKTPPDGKDKVKEMITELAPTSVSVELSASLALVLVSSDSLELGLTMEWTTEGFLKKYEEIWGAI